MPRKSIVGLDATPFSKRRLAMRIDLDVETPRLKLLRLQFLECDGGVILKRGRTQVKICGDGAADAVRTVLTAAAERDLDHDELCAIFPAPARPAVEGLLRVLEAKRLLVPITAKASEVPEDATENCLDVFYWHFGQSARQVKERLDEVAFAILGVNCISRQLAASLSSGGAERVAVINYPPFCNLRLFDDDGSLSPEEWPTSLGPPEDYRRWRQELDLDSAHCLIATTDFGGQELLRPWNQFCVTHRIPFLSVILQDLIGYVGPMVVPGETACLECLRARQNSNLNDAAAHRAPERTAWESQAINGFHPAMASILGDIAALEVTKFYGGLPGSRIAGQLVEVNLLAPQLTTRRILKIPRCPVCSPQRRRSPVSTDRDQYMPGNEVAP